METKCLISVVIPVFNVEPYLRKCINSIVSQTFEKIEIIIVDDGSTDRSGIISDEYKNDCRVKVIHKSNEGAAEARKIGVKAASGKYIAFVDSDDWIEYNTFEIISKVIDRYNADIITWGFSTVSIDNYVESKMNYNYCSGFYNEDDIVEKIYPTSLSNSKGIWGRDYIPALWNKVFKKELIVKNIDSINKEIIIGEDLALSFSCLLDAKSIYILNDQFLYYYRNTPYSIMKRYNKNYLHSTIKLIDCLDKCVEKVGVYDFKKQINANTIFFIIDILKNELKNEFYSPKELAQLIKKVIQYPRFKKALKDDIKIKVGLYNYCILRCLKKENIFEVLIELKFYRIIKKLKNNLGV
ncbi:glycosyltransferase family 2 protein [Eubacterium limosum]|uniref:glycosyltransferase family 2 protein n=1 Tax=Eubacterium limosum TaxID=1736 RepID=UPI0022E0AE2E|nr:glycosyltransferase [Eubacterium limosum]